MSARKKLEDKINADWRSGRFSEAFDEISANLCPILRDTLVSKGQRYQDAEDIVAAAMYGFAKKLRDPGSVTKPCNYLQTAVANCLRTHVKKTKKLPLAERDERDHRHINEATATQPTINNRKVFLVQAVTDIDEIAESDAKRLVSTVLKQVSPKYRRILRDLLKHGPRWTLVEAGARVRVNPGTYAVQKTRAFKAFQKLAAPTADRLGLTWRGIEEDSKSMAPNYAEEGDEEADDSDAFL